MTLQLQSEPEYRCGVPDLKKIGDGVRSWKQAGYQTFAINVNEMLDIIDFASYPHSNATERDKVLKALKKDLQSRFIPSNNQWSKGRNSGLLECCNIIDEYLTTFAPVQL